LQSAFKIYSFGDVEISKAKKYIETDNLAGIMEARSKLQLSFKDALIEDIKGFCTVKIDDEIQEEKIKEIYFQIGEQQMHQDMKEGLKNLQKALELAKHEHSKAEIYEKISDIYEA
jgi:hypothetical protein